MKDFLEADEPRYILVQYLCDVWRMETRNIGVVVWTPSGAAARFIGEKLDESGSFCGKVDIDRVPAWVEGDSAYAQWVECWRTLLMSRQIRPLRGGELVSVASVRFLEGLREFTSNNYLMIDGGTLIDVEGDAEECADYLFDAFVLEDNTGIADSSNTLRVDWFCSRLRRETGIDQNPRFKHNYAISPNSPKSGVDTLTFSYGFEGNNGLRVYEAVPFPGGPTDLRRTVRSTAWLLEQALNGGVVDKENATAVISVPEVRLGQNEVHNSLSLLKSYCRVINLQNEADTLRQEWGLLAQQRPPVIELIPSLFI